MIEEPPLLMDTATTVDFTVPVIPDDDQPMVAVTSDEAVQRDSAACVTVQRHETISRRALLKSETTRP